MGKQESVPFPTHKYHTIPKYCGYIYTVIKISRTVLNVCLTFIYVSICIIPETTVPPYTLLFTLDWKTFPKRPIYRTQYSVFLP